MTGFEFTADLVGSLAWPTALVVVVSIFKRPLSRVILALGKLKWRDLEVEFGEELRVLKGKAERILPSPTKSSEESDFDYLTKIETFASMAPSAAIEVAWAEIELAAREALSRIDDNHQASSSRSLTTRLAESGILSGEQITLLESLRHLRWLAVHSPRMVSKQEAIEYGDMSAQMVFYLEEVNSKK